MPRRLFSKLASLVVAGAIPGTRAVANARQQRVLIVGAGVAGLATAQMLMQQGHEVPAARDGSGGRIWRSTRWPDAPLDLGATWDRDPVAGCAQSWRRPVYSRTSDQKAQRYRRLGDGVLNKCYLRCATAFWPTAYDWLEYIPAQRGARTAWVSFVRAADLPVLLGFNAADQGHEIESWTDDEIVASALRTLRIMFGRSVPPPEDCQIARWAADPFARGSYSFNALGSTPEMREHLAESLNGRVFFAGEATERDHFSTAHGAYLSGLRAAEEVMRAA